MSNSTGLDARKDQLKLLKLERRSLRPMALTALDRSLSKKVKIAAVSGVAAAIIALHGAPQSYAARLGVDPAVAVGSEEAIDRACLHCKRIADLIERNATETELMESLAKLFSLVDSEHERLERIAKQAGAKLLPVGGDENATGSGGKDENAPWLARLTNNKVTGTGGKDDNATWLSRISDKKATGTGGKDDNATWLSSRLNDKNATGTGGKEENSAWLSRQKDKKAIGTGGKEDNASWLSRQKISGLFSSR